MSINFYNAAANLANQVKQNKNSGKAPTHPIERAKSIFNKIKSHRNEHSIQNTLDKLEEFAKERTGKGLKNRSFLG